MDFAKIRENRSSRKEEMKKREELERITACFTGHRPDKIGGYDMKNPTAMKIKEKLSKTIEHLIVDEGIQRFITGGALGFDTYAFECVHRLKEKYPTIKNILAIPFEKQASVWTDYQKRVYERMKEIADENVFVDTLPRYKEHYTSEGEYHISKMQKRNEYMVDHSKIVVACWDGSKGGTANCVRYAGNHKTLYRLFPPDFDMEIRYGLSD